jgi:dTDP-4-dehydrorhamnose reductase
MKIMIIGKSSCIGSAITDLAIAEGIEVTFTSREEEFSPCYLDLASIKDDWVPPTNVDMVILCAAATSMKWCEANSLASWKINAEAPGTIAQAIQKQKKKMIFLSSEQVFSGTTLRPSVKTPKNPQSVYGKQKAQAEELVQANLTNSAIVRLTKVVHPKLRLFCDWSARLAKNQTIEAYKDLQFCPISLEYVAQNIIHLIKEFKKGTYHLSGDCEISYQTAAKWMADVKGVTSELVKGVVSPKEIQRSHSLLEPHLPSDRIGSPKNARDTLTKVFKEMNS